MHAVFEVSTGHSRGRRGCLARRALVLFVLLLAGCVTGKPATLATETEIQQLVGSWEGGWYADNGSSGGFTLRIDRLSGNGAEGASIWRDTVGGTSSVPFVARISDNQFVIERNPDYWIKLRRYTTDGGGQQLKGDYSTVGAGTVYLGSISVSRK